MRKSRFSETQIVEILKEGEAGLPVGELLRKHGISRATYFQWKAKYSGATVADLKRLKELETENSRAQAPLQRAGPGECRPPGGRAPKTLAPSAKRQVVALLVEEFRLSRRRACRAVGLSQAA